MSVVAGPGAVAWAEFAAAVLVIELTPGPNMAWLVTLSLSEGRRAGLLATAGQMMMTRAYAIGRVLSNASLQYLGILFSYLYGVLLFGDAITWPALIGVWLIVAAGLATTLLRASTPAPASPDTRSGHPSQL